MDQRRKILLFTLGYLAWQVGFSIALSPLVFGVLSAKQMGYTLQTVWMGILVGGAILVVIAAVGRWTNTSVWLFGPALKKVKTREQFEQFWTVAKRGCDDGLIAETHWSGIVLPLFMVAFSVAGVPFPLNVIPAIFCRWVAHAGVHFMFPRTKSGGSIFGGASFLIKGLLLSDIKNSLAFLISGSIIAPAMMHHLDAYVTIWTGNKNKVAESLGIPP